MQKLLLILVPLALVGVYFFPGSSIELPTEQLPEEELVETISKGEAVDLEDHLRADRWTLIEYGAVW